MRTPVALPPILKSMEQRMPERRRFTQTTSLEERLAKEATQLRKQARGTPPGVERDLLVRKARRAIKIAQTGVHDAAQLSALAITELRIR
jgi:hypothetical protein